MNPVWFDASRRIARRGWYRLTGRPSAQSADREVLEQVVLPHYARREDVERLLFVGVRWYTRHYPALLPGRRFISIDIDSSSARHAVGSDRHIVGDVRDVAHWLLPGSIDVAVFNGVFGWGLDDAAGMQRALSGLSTVLRARGELVMGWNNVARRCPFDWHALPALAAFEPLPFQPLGNQTRLDLATDNRHVYEFFVRR